MLGLNPTVGKIGLDVLYVICVICYFKGSKLLNLSIYLEYLKKNSSSVINKPTDVECSHIPHLKKSLIL